MIRRAFATPFVLTVACGSSPPPAKPTPIHDNPPGPVVTPEPARPAGPCDKLKAEMCAGDAGCERDFDAESPRDKELTQDDKNAICAAVLANPDVLAQMKKGAEDKRRAAQTTVTWVVTKTGGSCRAVDNTTASRPVKCPDSNMPDGGSVTITQQGGVCTIDAGPPAPCAQCNPPPPRKVDCP